MDMVRKKRLDEVISFKLRMPEGLRQKIEAEAEKSERSMNSEILWRLGQTFGDEWQRFIAGVEEKEKREAELSERVMANIAQWEPFQKFLKEEIARQAAMATAKKKGEE
jgi:Arc-like DNA binding domain